MDILTPMADGGRAQDEQKITFTSKCNWEGLKGLEAIEAFRKVYQAVAEPHFKGCFWLGVMKDWGMKPYSCFFHLQTGELYGYDTRKNEKTGNWDIVGDAKPLYPILDKELREGGKGLYWKPDFQANGINAANWRGTVFIGFEFDHLSKEEQRARIAEMEEAGIKFCFIFDSAKKSYHAFAAVQYPITDKDKVVYYKELAVPLGNDINTCRESNWMRAAFGHRHDTDREQALLFADDQVNREYQLVNGFREIYARRGWDFPEFEEWKKKRNAKTLASDYEATDLEGIEDSDAERIINAFLDAVPQKIPGDGTRNTWRAAVVALTRLRDKEYVLARLAEHSPGYDFRGMLAGSTGRFGLRSIIEAGRELSGDSHWTLPVSFTEKYQPARRKGFGLVERLKKSLKRPSRLQKGLKQIGELFEGHHAQQLAKTLSELRERGVGHSLVWVPTDTGGGKTHEITLLDNETGKIIYVSIGHRDLGLPAHVLEGYKDIIPMNKYDFVLDGNRYVLAKSTTPEQDRVKLGGHCEFAPQLHTLRSKGYDDISLCGGCPFKSQCESTPGWYKHDARETWKHPKIRCDIRSLQVDHISPGDRLIIDEESSAVATETTEGPYTDMTEGFSTLRRSSNQPLETKTKLRRLEFYLEKLVKDDYQPQGEGLTEKQKAIKKRAKYGYGQSDLIRGFGKLVSSFSPRELMQMEADLALSDDIRKGDSIDVDDPNLYDGLSAKAAKELRAGLLQASGALSRGRKIEELPANILPLFLRSFSDPSIQIHLGRGKRARVTATIRNNKLQQLMSVAKETIILDASATPLSIKLTCGREPDAIIRKEVKKHGNITIRLIRTDGTGTNTYTDKAIEQVKQVKQELEDRLGLHVPGICHKKHKADLGMEGHWGKDHRATNRFSGESDLILVGMPWLNIGALKAEYAAMGGEDCGFDDYYQDRINQEVLQAPGRLRADRPEHRNKKFTVHWFVPPDVDLSWLERYGYKVEDLDIAELDPTLGNRSFQCRLSVLSTLQRLVTTHAKVTVGAIAKELGVSREAVTKLLKGIGIEALTHRMEKFVKYKGTENRPLVDSISASSQDEGTSPDLIATFRDFLGLPAAQILKTVLDWLQFGGIEGFDQVMESFPDIIQAKIWAVLTPFLWDDPDPDPA